MEVQNQKALTAAMMLSFITIGYNLIEGGISIYFGLSDGTLALLGFGVDSFVEVLSGLGIAHMILRMRNSKVESSDQFERFALRITGICFYILTFGLIIGSILNIIQNEKPNTTIPGIIISAISIISMTVLMKYKLKVGKELNNKAIIADAHCTKTCLNLSIILLISSFLYIFLKIGYIDTLGSLAIAYLSFKEGKESLEKSKSLLLACNGERE